MQVHASSPAKQWLFKRALQAAHHRRVALEAGAAPGPLLRLEHGLLDRLVLSKIRDSFGGKLKASSTSS
jgi:long-subunit acyl-CoA synthetase (AMP-forming)